MDLEWFFERLKEIKALKGPGSLERKELIFWDLLEQSQGKVLKLFDKKMKKRYNFNQALFQKSLENVKHAVEKNHKVVDLIELNENLIHDVGTGSTTRKVTLMEEFLKNNLRYTSWLKRYYEKGDWNLAFDEKAMVNLLVKKFPTEKERIKKKASLVQDYRLYQIYIWLKNQELLESKKSQESEDKKTLPMLASPYNDRTFLKGRFSAELKYDGIRVLIRKDQGKLSFWTRSGLDLDSQNVCSLLPTTTKEVLFSLPDKTTIDGEIWTPNPLAGEGFRALIPLVKTKILTKPLDYRLVVFDLLEYEGLDRKTLKYHERRSFMVSLGWPFLVKSYKIKTKTQITRTLAKLSLTEGLVLKRIDSLYQPGKRSLDWLKVKRSYDSLDLEVITFHKGSGKYENTVSSLQVAALKGQSLVSLGFVGSGFSEKDLLELESRIKNKERMIVEVECEALTKSIKYPSGWAMRFPRFKRFRDDRVNPNTLEEVKKVFFKS